MSPLYLSLLNQKTLQIKILPNLFSQDLIKVKELSSRKWNPSSRLWEVPIETLGEIKAKWNDHELIFKGQNLEEAVKSLDDKPKDLSQLPSYLGKIESPRNLFPFQEKYVRLSSSIRRTILALPTGAGKSISSILRYKVLGDKSLLIICPKILRVNWQETLRIDFGIESVIYWGTSRQKAKIDLNSKNVVITTYETIKDLARIDFEHLIVDEAHLLSDPTKQRFKTFEKYFNSLENIKSLQLLSGTPIQHKPKNLWSLVHFIDPIKAGSYSHWCHEYEEVIRSFRKEITVKDRNGNIVRDLNGNPKTFEKEVPLITKTKNLHKLRDKLSSVMFRVSREEALECQEDQELIYLDLTKEQERLYNSIKEEIVIELANKTLSVQHAPVRMLRLLQACEGLFNFYEESLESTKLEYLTHEIDNTDEKLVIWSRFKPITYILQKLYPNKVAIYNGDISDPLKQLSIWAFNGVKDKDQLETYKRLQDKYSYPFNPGEAPIWAGVIDPKSSLGFDLHCPSLDNPCNRQILPSYSFLSSANYQATSRLIRLGQKRDFVSTQYLVCKNTIEPSALRLITRNFQTALKILDGENSSSVRLSSQLIGLLKD